MSEIETARAHAELASRQLARSEHGAALESLSTALRLAPGLPALWTQFAGLIRYFNLRHPVPPLVRELLARALEHPAVDPGDLVRPISTLALSQPSPLEEPLLLRLLEDVVIRDPALERVITETRRRMLDEALPLPVMVAIAHQCFNTEYVFDETAAERERVDRLRHSLASLHSYASYAAYRPLEDANLEGTPLASLARRQFLEPKQERYLAATIPAMAGVQSRVSAAVQAQYEANPYPRWVRMQQGFPGQPLAQQVRRILVAGCGTGQHAISAAQRFPGASVLAVDLSLASLAYAKRKTVVSNVEYRQADILGLAGIDERFDLIECSGVLHHLEDPFEGWRILAGLRNPGGLMRIGLYSELGRRAVVRARELIAAEGFTADAAGIRSCRAAIRARTGDELFARIARTEDFYSMSGCRDLLFHVQEHRFTLPQIKAMLEGLGLRVVELEFPDSGETLARYRARFPQDPGALDLDNWHRLEQEFPDTFARMYQFWVS
jgi:2-polyprenyl-3-methyl-5-hydroxy-6-metoxy-1,4-benzoquinol methylase